MLNMENNSAKRTNRRLHVMLQLVISIGIIFLSSEFIMASESKTATPTATNKVHELMGKLYLTADPAKKAAICERIKTLGVVTVPTMIEYLKQKTDPFNELNASECLVQIGELAVPLLLQDLISQAKSKSMNESDIGRLAGVIVKIGKEGVPHIKKHLKSSNQSVVGLMEGLMLVIESK